jgi:hypothetical protein
VGEENDGADRCRYIYGIGMIEVRSDLRVETPQSIATVLVDAMYYGLPGIEYLIDVVSTIDNYYQCVSRDVECQVCKKGY